MDAIAMALEEIRDEHSDIAYKIDEPFRNHTSFRIGGPVRVMFFPKTTIATTQLCSVLSRNSVAPLVMGNGSNILSSDSKHELAVINTTCLSAINKTGDTEITAEAGALLSRIAVFARDNGLAGFEFAHGIPGTLGGAVVMNAGAYDGEMKDVVTATTAYNTKAGVYKMAEGQHEFGYRHSRFSDIDDIVLSSVIRLQKGESGAIGRKMDELGAKRKEKQPLELPSAGSTFKRPKGAYAAELIDRSGLRGFAVGGAKVSEKHAGFVVNYREAAFDDVIAVIEHVQEAVLKQFNIKLELEVKVIKT